MEERLYYENIHFSILIDNILCLEVLIFAIFSSKSFEAMSRAVFVCLLMLQKPVLVANWYFYSKPHSDLNIASRQTAVK